jgi:hypothetical protein
MAFFADFIMPIIISKYFLLVSKIFILAFILIFQSANCQEMFSDGHINKENSASFDKKLNSGRLGDEVFFSAKLGYHFPFQQNDIEGIPGGLTFDGSAEFPLGKNIYAGANLEYWNSSNWVSVPGYNSQIERENSAWSYSLSLKIRKDIGIVNFIFGGLIGDCMMTASSAIGGTERNYLSVSFLFGFDIYLSKRLAITSQAEYRSLNRTEDTPKTFLEIKLGPTILLK